MNNIKYLWFFFTYKKCLSGEFGCSDGECIPLEQRCDGVPDCSGNFDEQNCNTVSTDYVNYHKELAPHQRNSDGTTVWIKIIVSSISSINEIDMTITAKFLIELEW